MEGGAVVDDAPPALHGGAGSGAFRARRGGLPPLIGEHCGEASPTGDSALTTGAFASISRARHTLLLR